MQPSTHATSSLLWVSAVPVVVQSSWLTVLSVCLRAAARSSPTGNVDLQSGLSSMKERLDGIEDSRVAAQDAVASIIAAVGRRRISVDQEPKDALVAALHRLFKPLIPAKNSPHTHSRTAAPLS